MSGTSILPIVKKEDFMRALTSWMRGKRFVYKGQTTVTHGPGRATRERGVWQGAKLVIDGDIEAEDA